MKEVWKSTYCPSVNTICYEYCWTWPLLICQGFNIVVWESLGTHTIPSLERKGHFKRTESCPHNVADNCNVVEVKKGPSEPYTCVLRVARSCQTGKTRCETFRLGTVPGYISRMTVKTLCRNEDNVKMQRHVIILLYDVVLSPFSWRTMKNRPVNEAREIAEITSAWRL